MAHMPFGWGPRSCIATKLGLMAAKMTLIAIMKEYKFVEAPDTEKVCSSQICSHFMTFYYIFLKPIKSFLGFILRPANGVYLYIEKRH